VSAARRPFASQDLTAIEAAHAEAPPATALAAREFAERHLSQAAVHCYMAKALIAYSKLYLAPTRKDVPDQVYTGYSVGSGGKEGGPGSRGAVRLQRLERLARAAGLAGKAGKRRRLELARARRAAEQGEAVG
jgi:hypothetical protein